MRQAAILILGMLALAAPADAGVVQGASIDGPSADIQSVGGVALAQDSSGGVVYVKNDAGAPHIFVAILTHGVWSSPERVDLGVNTPSSAPVIAAADNGRLAVAFLSGGTLYGAVRIAGTPALGGPQALGPGLSDPSLAMGISGAAYVSWTAPETLGTSVRAARLDRTASTFEPLPAALSSSPQALPGTGPNRSRVAMSADGTGLVTWSQVTADGHTHVLARRVFGLSATAAPIDLTLDQLAGQAGASADSAVAGLQDDSSFAFVAFRETFSNAGGAPVSRVVLRPLLGDQPQPPETIDGLGFPATEGAEAPSLAIAGAGDGIAAVQLQASHQVIGAASAGNGFTPGQRINAADAPQMPFPAAAVSRDGTGLVAFAPDAGSVQGRLYDGGTPGDQFQLSRPEFGPVDGGGGLAAAADDNGDQIVGYLQGDPANHRVAVADVVTPPAPFKGLTVQRAMRTRRPVLSWEDTMDSWSAVRYTVSIDGRPIGTTTATELKVPTALANGTHHWRVTATDSLGQVTAAPTRLLRIGSKGALSLRVSGPLKVGSKLTVSVLVTGKVKRVRISFGDGGSSNARRATHTYRRAGKFTLSATVTTAAGKRVTAKRSVQIK